MSQPGLIADYCADVARNLRFDPQLACRVRAEVEDHLFEALEARGEAASMDAEREAIRAFGDAHAIARAFVPDALQSLARRTAVLTALAVIAVFAAMVARIAWYGWVAWPAGDNVRAAAAIALPIDRYASAAAFLAALIGLAYVMLPRAPARPGAAFGRRIARGLRLAAIAVLALSAAIAVELVLTVIRFAESELDPMAVVPALLLLLEVIAAATCAIWLGAATRRLSLALRLAGER